MERRIVPFAMLYLCAPLVSSGCATLSEERSQVRAMVVERLDCPADWHGPHVEEADDSPVRHWSASCDHRAVRITCARQGCSEEVERPRLLCDMPLELSSRAAAAGASDPSASH